MTTETIKKRTEAEKDAVCLYRQTGDPKACLNCQLPECIECEVADEVISDDEKFILNSRPTNPSQRCPYCHSKNSLVKVGTISDKGGAKRNRYICRSCWRWTSDPSKIGRRSPLVHVAPAEVGAEIDLSSVSRRAVAEKVHCHPTTVSQILCGRITASLPLFYDIAKACGCTMDELFKTISGANGKNPARLKYKREPSSWCEKGPIPPKYTVNGKGYPNLREALLSLGIERRKPTHYNALPPEVQAQITRNRPFRGR